jgi:hypothetical protein
LLVASLRRLDRARASASGTEEDFKERDQLLLIVTAVDDFSERGRAERLEMEKRDKKLVKARKNIIFQAMNSRASGDGGELDGKEGALDGSGSVDEIMTTRKQPIEVIDIDESGKVSDEFRKRKRSRGPDDLEETLVAAEAKRVEQEDLRLTLDRERLEFERARAEKLDSREAQRIELMSSQNELKRQQRDNIMLKMKKMSVMEEMVRKLEL